MDVSRQTFDDPIERSIAGVYAPADVRGATAPGAVTVSLIRKGEIDDALRAEWRALGAESADPNPYFSQWFLEPALTHLDPSDDVWVCLLRRAMDDVLVGLAPLVFQKGYSKLPLKHVCVWTHKHCFNGAPLIRKGFTEAVFAALFNWVDTHPEGSTFIRFAHLPFDHPMHEALSEACHLRSRGYRVQAYHERAILTAENDFDAVMKAAMTGKKRKELRRQANRFGELGTAEFSDLPINDEVVSHFLDLESAGWKATDPEGFPLAQSVAESRFFREAMMAGAEQGAVVCTALTLDERPTAMLFSLRMGDRLAAFKTTYDESLRAYSPGVQLLIEATRRVLDAGEECVFAGFDMLDSCAKQGHPVVDGLWPERLPIAQVNVPAQRVTDKTLLGTAATLEGLKNRALKRLTKAKD